MILFTTGDNLAIEVEVGCASLIIQQTGGTVNLSPLHHVTVFSGSHAAKQLVSGSHERRLSDHQLLDILCFDALGVHLVFQLEVWIGTLEVKHRHLIVVGLRVTEFGARLGRLGQSRLDLHDVLHLLLGSFLLEAEQAEHTDDVLLISLPDFDGGRVVLHIVVFLPKRQSTL